MRWRRFGEAWWFLACAVLSSVWCLTASARLGPTFDEPIYLERGLQGWRDHSHWGLLQLGTMPLPIDVQTFPLYLCELAQGTPFDPQADLDQVLPWMRAGNLIFWWLLLWYGGLIGRSLAGPWGGSLAVAMLAFEPNLLAHAALATTDIAITACLLAFLYHFRAGREAGWFRRLAIPGLWFGLAIVAKASAVVYGPICLIVVELERLFRGGAFSGQGENTWRQQLGNAWQKLKPARRDFPLIGLGGLAVAIIYCGSDFKTQPAFVAWAKGLDDGLLSTYMVWFSENLCIFSNAIEGIVRQIKHNMRGHGTFLLGEGYPRALWYYFPVLLTIKLSLPVLLAPLIVLATGRLRTLANWVCWTALALVVFSLTFRVQIGIRLVLPLVGLGIVGLSAAVVNAVRDPQWKLARPVAASAMACGLMWMIVASISVWPNGLCFINEAWGGTAHGYRLVSDSNYDWGQGLPELLAWQAQNGSDVDVWYFGRDQADKKPPLREVLLHAQKVDSPADVLKQLEGRYLAVSTTLLYGQATTLEAHHNAAAFLRQCRPAARTATFLIYERQSLIEASQRITQFTPRPPRTAN